MLYILTALKCEASALTGLPGEILVTGAGQRANQFLSKFELKPDDFVLNAGICAGLDKRKGYLINRVISEETGRRFYPDILFESGASEMPLTTSAGIVTEVGEGMLYDMEAALICEKVLKVIPPSNLAIYKVVSDSGDSFPKANEVTGLMREHRDVIAKIASLLCEEGCEKEYGFLPENICDELRLTQYMRNELMDIEHYCAVSGKEEELKRILAKMREEGRIPASSKKAGREVLDEIYSYLR